MSDNNMNTILGMLDHVNELSDAEISHFINDKEARACYETIVLVRQAFHSSADTSLYSQGRTSSILNYPFSIFNSKRIAAALIILLIMVATLGFAAFHFFGRREGM